MPKEEMPLLRCVRLIKNKMYGRFKDVYSKLCKEGKEEVETFESLMKIYGKNYFETYQLYKRRVELEGGVYPEVSSKAVHIFVTWIEHTLTDTPTKEMEEDLSQLLGEKYFTIHKKFFLKTLEINQRSSLLIKMLGKSTKTKETTNFLETA